jgi:hypothetical protein
MSKISTKSKVIVAGVAGLSLGISGVAYAYWTTSGSGSGSATAAGTAGTLSLTTPTTPVVTGLVPGSFIDVPVTASNSSTTTSLQANTLTVDNLAVDGAHAGCLLLVTKPTIGATNPASAVTVAPSDSAAFGKVTISLANSGTENQDSCKNAVFTFDLHASTV